MFKSFIIVSVTFLICLQKCIWFTNAKREDNIAALILARGGSRGLRLKNLAKVGGASLLSRSVGTARLAGFHDVTVSTDHPLIALEALKYDAQVLHRTKVTATDTAPSLWGVSEFLASRRDLHVVVLLQATSPFIRASDLRQAVKLLNTPAHDCVFAAIRSHNLRWRETDGRLEAINFSPSARPRRQDWSGELIETGAFYIARRSIVEKGLLQNKNCSVLELSARDSLEIDSHRDLRLANLMINSGYFN